MYFCQLGSKPWAKCGGGSQKTRGFQHRAHLDHKEKQKRTQAGDVWRQTRERIARQYQVAKCFAVNGRNWGLNGCWGGSTGSAGARLLARISKPLSDLLYLRGRLRTVAHGTAPLGRCVVGASGAVASEAPPSSSGSSETPNKDRTLWNTKCQRVRHPKAVFAIKARPPANGNEN